ncbi:MAG: accessory factor UbiK family protein [Alphaproteobacteria bacterium]|nr:accessory factor UbiK family protein [Alphaproteobacteria bacterium]
MQTRNPILDDLARVAAGALGVASGLRRETEELLKQRFAAVLGREGFVTREEFEAVKAMAAKARAENESLAARIAELEAAGDKASRAKPATAPRRGGGGRSKARKPRTTKS